MRPPSGSVIIELMANITNISAAKRPELIVRDVRQIRVLASPMRQLVLDTLEALGIASVAELATTLQVPADRLYFHLHALERAGLVRAVSRVRRGGRPGTVYAPGGRRSRLQYAPGDAANVAAVTSVVSSMVRAALREFRKGFQGAPAVTGSRRELWGARRVAWLDPTALAAVNAGLSAVFRHFERRRARARGRPYAITVLLSPLVRRPHRKDRSS